MLNLTWSWVGISILIILITAWFIRKPKRCHISTLSGPKGWPIIGSAFDIGKSLPPHQTIAKWSEKYGPVFTVRMPNADWFVACDYASIYELLVTKGYEAGARPVAFRTKLASRGLRGVLMTQTDSPWWMAQRKAFHRSTKLFGDGLIRMEG